MAPSKANARNTDAPALFHLSNRIQPAGRSTHTQTAPISDECLIRHGKKKLEQMLRINGDVVAENAWKCNACGAVAALEAG
jgi:hypothetical protein